MNINEQRSIALFNAVDFFAFGTLWKIKNFLWRKAIKGFVSKNGAGFHPAVSLGKKNLTSFQQTVPMLLGSHSNKTGFPIRGFSAEKEKHIGFFKIKPYRFKIADAVGPRRGIEPNSYKPHLDQAEIAELKKYLSKKGIRFDE